jgi:CubicO group peptidase (beta-lactamase class C family)
MAALGRRMDGPPVPSVEVTIGRRSVRQGAAVCAAVLLIQLASSVHAATPPIPGRAWEKVAPAAVGLDAAKLDEIAAQARKGQSNCLVVVRDGKLAGEWYFRGARPSTMQDVFSVTKSVTSTLVGIAQDDGDLRIGDSASKWIPRWQGTQSEAVTVRNLLSMDSGREWSPLTDFVRLLASPSRTAFAIGLDQESAPGTVWAYNNSAVQTLEPVLETATGESVVAFAERRLLEPLGMTHTTMAIDSAGDAQLFEGIHSTCRDMARFGVLMLNQGRWGGRQIVSSRWVKQATGRSSTKLNAAYGYLWWLNREGVMASVTAATSLHAVEQGSTEKGRLVAGAPDSMYWALGLGNQLIQIDPASRTVVVRLGTAAPFPLPPTFGPAAASRVVTEALERG